MKKHTFSIRWLLTNMLAIERKYVAKIKNSHLLQKIAHTYLFSMEPKPLGRGIAIGLFWMCMPMPFQMLPTFLFCWLGFANLPIALLLVWISNPLTYLPIFYLEYNIGRLVFHFGEDVDISFNEFTAHYTEIMHSAGYLYHFILEGALVLGVTLAIIGYFAGAPLSRYIKRRLSQRRK